MLTLSPNTATGIDPKEYNLPGVGTHSFLLDPQPASVFNDWGKMVKLRIQACQSLKKSFCN